MHIGIFHHITLREAFQIFETGRAFGFVADGFLDAFSKFRRQRGFQANQWHSVFTVRLANFQAVCSMRVDQHLITLIDVANGGNPRCVAAAAGHKAVILDFRKKRCSG